MIPWWSDVSSIHFSNHNRNCGNTIKCLTNSEILWLHECQIHFSSILSQFWRNWFYSNLLITISNQNFWNFKIWILKNCNILNSTFLIIWIHYFSKFEFKIVTNIKFKFNIISNLKFKIKFFLFSPPCPTLDSITPQNIQVLKKELLMHPPFCKHSTMFLSAIFFFRPPYATQVLSVEKLQRHR